MLWTINADRSGGCCQVDYLDLTAFQCFFVPILRDCQRRFEEIVIYYWKLGTR